MAEANEVNTMESLRLWLRKCPALDKNSRFNVDYMGKGATEYALYSSPSSIRTKTDILGNLYLDSTQELNYLFISLMPLSKDILENLENLGFYDSLLKWIYQQNTLRNFPQIAEGRVKSIMPTLSPYLFDADANAGRYQIQLKIKYRPY